MQGLTWPPGNVTLKVFTYPSHLLGHLIGSKRWHREFIMSETFPIVEHFPYLGIFLLVILGTLGCPFPEDTILILCGFLISQGVLEPVPTFLIIYPTLLLTDTFLYSAGRRYGRKVIELPRFGKILSPRRLQSIETRFKKWGAWVIVIGRPVPGLRTQLFLVSGTLRMPIMKFLIADGISVLIAIGTMGAMGYLGGHGGR
jgi:membrane protein DedA with SNARE-associated domain